MSENQSLVYVTWNDDVILREIMMSKQPPSWISKLKLIFINKNTKITNLEKNACQNAVAMVTSSFWHKNLAYQIICW